MTARLFMRLIASLAIVFGALSVILLTLGQMQNVQAMRSTAATDYTVGGPCGATIQACIKNPSVVNGDRILIPAGVYTESLTLNKAVSLVGANAGTTIIRAVSGQRVMTVTGSIITATTIISGVSITGGRVASNWSCPTGCGGGIWLDNAAQPLIQNVIISDNQAYWGGGLFAMSDLTLTNASVLSNTAQSGGGLYASFQAALIGGRFKGNSAEEMMPGEGDGGGLRATNLTLIGTEFISNVASRVGGGAYVGGLATISGGRFSDNRAGAGGGLYAAELILTATEFISNAAVASGGLAIGAGGGAWAGHIANPNAGGANIVNARFENNRGAAGGGLYVGQSIDTVFTLSNTQFINNTAGGSGGGVFASGQVSVTGGRFERNTAGGDGAGLYALELNLTGTVLVRNTATGSGGGISCCSGYAGSRIVNALLANNTAGGSGAGLFASPVGTYLAVLHTTIADANINPKSAVEIYAKSGGSVGITDTIIASHTVGISFIGGGGTVGEDYNLLFGNISDRSGIIITGIYDVKGNPRFINPAADNYRLASGSAAIDRGVYVGVKTDLDGNSRLRGYGGLRPDIGAYEYHFQGVIYDTFLPLVRRGN